MDGLSLTSISEEEEEMVVSHQELKQTGLVRIREGSSELDALGKSLHGFSFATRKTSTSHDDAVNKAKFAKSVLISTPVSSPASNSVPDTPPALVLSQREQQHQQQGIPVQEQQQKRQVGPPMLSIKTSSAASAGSGFGVLSPSLATPLFTPKVRFSPSDNACQAMLSTSSYGQMLMVNDLMKALTGLRDGREFSGGDNNPSINEQSGQQQQAKNILDLICPEYHNEVKKTLAKAQSVSEEKVLLCGKIVRMKKQETSVAVSVWCKKKLMVADMKQDVLIWIFQAIDECITECTFEIRTGIITGFHGLFLKLFELSEDDIQKTAISRIFPAFTGQDIRSKLAASKYFGARTLKSGKTFPVILKVKSSTNAHVVLQIISMPSISGAIVVSSQNDQILTCSSAVSKYLLGFSDKELLAKTVNDVIPTFAKVKDLISKVDSEKKDALFSASVMKKLVNGATVTPLSPQAPSPVVSTIFEKHISGGNSTVKGSVDFIQVRHRDGTLFDVELQVRKVRDSVYNLWLSFKRPIDVQLELLGDPLASPEIDEKAQARESEKEPQMDIKPEIQSNSGERRSFTQKESVKKKDRKLSDYELVQKLGEGAFGFVHLAKLKSDPERKVVVLKYILKKRILMDTYTADSELGVVPLEVSILNYLRQHPHPNITKMTAMFQDREYLFVEMALHGSGMDLFDYIEYNQDMKEKELKFILKQTISAVKHLHLNNIIHRDIKDENIVIDQNSRIQLIDFGSSTWIRKGKKFSVFCGTMDYASPEVLLGNSYTGPPQDMWAVGILLYTLLYKENPFYNVDEIIDATLRIPFVASKGSLQLLQMLLSKSPDKRPTAEQALDHPWLND